MPHNRKCTHSEKPPVQKQYALSLLFSNAEKTWIRIILAHFNWIWGCVPLSCFYTKPHTKWNSQCGPGQQTKHTFCLVCIHFSTHTERPSMASCWAENVCRWRGVPDEPIKTKEKKIFLSILFALCCYLSFPKSPTWSVASIWFVSLTFWVLSWICKLNITQKLNFRGIKKKSEHLTFSCIRFEGAPGFTKENQGK